MDEKTKIELLRDEYLLLQQFYEDFDKRVLGIKGWSATIAIAAIGGGFAQSRFLWLFASCASLAFWLLESVWKGFQYQYASRIVELEKAFRKGKFEKVHPFQIYESWFKSFKENGYQIAGTFKLGIVAFPHAVTFIAGAVLFVLESLGVFSLVRNSPTFF